MGKRKRKGDSVNSIRRKLRRLEKKLERSKQYEDCGEGSQSSSSYMASERWSEDRDLPDMEDEYTDENYVQSKLASVVSAVTNPTPASAVVLDPHPVLGQDAPAAPTTETGPTVTQQSSSAVPDEILQLLGQSKVIEDTLGEKIPTEISERWGKILLDGLAKDQKESLMEKMLIPENFLLARAPKLNPEVNAVLSDAAKNRDKRLEKAQSQLGSGIAGLVNLTKDLITSDVEKIEIIKRLSEISQILLDLHYEETVNRRKLITPLLDKTFWNTIQGVKRESYLFGDKLGENIKTSKEIERSGQQIKKPTLKRPFQAKPPMSGNARLPPRHANTSNPTAGPSHERQTSAATRRNTTATQSRHRRQPASKSRSHRRR